jgi:hypothetical protein
MKDVYSPLNPHNEGHLLSGIHGSFVNTISVKHLFQLTVALIKNTYLLFRNVLPTCVGSYRLSSGTASLWYMVAEEFLCNWSYLKTACTDEHV